MPAATKHKPQRRKGLGPRTNTTPGQLLPQHENFAQAVAEGLSGAEAYRKCVATKWIERDTAQSGASALLANPLIFARVSSLRLEFNEFLAKKAGFTKETMGMYFVDSLETPIGEITQNHKLASKLTLNDEGGVKSIEMFSKEAAAEKLIKMAGWNAEEKTQVTHTTTAEIRAAMDKMFAKKIN